MVRFLGSLFSAVILVCLAAIVPAGAAGGSHSFTASGFNYDGVAQIVQDSVPISASSHAIVGDLGDCIGTIARAAGPPSQKSHSFVAPSEVLDDFADVGSGASLIRRVDVDGVPVSIKSGHGYRPDHGSVDITGVLGRDAVDSAVATDLATRVGAGTSVTRAGSGHSTFQTVVGGHTVEYRAVFVPATGRYEVGTCYIP